MLDKEGKNIDAVIVATPDHMHATAAMWCMERGKHVYVQKPLVRTVWEARQLREAAAKYKVATQMGNQGYSNEGTRQCAEIVWNGDIGDVTEVHAWSDRPLWPQGLTEIPQGRPGSLHSRLGSLARHGGEAALHGGRQDRARPQWAASSTSRSTGAASTISAAARWATWPATFWARRTWRCISRNRKLVSVECIKKEGVSPFMFPKASVIRFDFAAYGNMPALKVFWYDGLKENPKIPGVPEGEWLGDPPSPDAADRAVRRGARRAAGSGGAPRHGDSGRRRRRPATISARPAGSSTGRIRGMKAARQHRSASRRPTAASSSATRAC